MVFGRIQAWQLLNFIEIVIIVRTLCRDEKNHILDQVIQRLLIRSDEFAL
jgi:hypothetical protein